ncbi:hypothetical protein ACROYT_G017748 [Oculina patagonica]
MARDGSQSKSKPSMISFYLIVALCVSVSCQQRRPRIVSWPSNPFIGKSNGDASLYWSFVLLPNETWNGSIFEVVFGVWRYPGYLKKKLMVIDTRGEVLIRRNYEKKISCKFNMSRLQVAFTLHNLSIEDEKPYGLQVEFDLARSPLTDTVTLRIEDPPKITNPLQRNLSVRTGEDLDLKCQASGVPEPVVTWTRHGRVFKNQTLYLKRVTASDSGLYLCRANNQAGEDSKEIVVTVNDYNDKSPQTPVPNTPAPSEAAISPVWIALVVICGLLIIIALIVFLSRSRVRYKRNTPYEPQIDTKTPSRHSIPAAI